MGHVGSDAPSIVHFCEHTGCGIWSTEFVQTPLLHSVDVSLTVLHVAPNVPAGGPSTAASAAVFESGVQAAIRTRRQVAIRMRIMVKLLVGPETNGYSHVP
jgi:hypothetical protein